MMLKPIRKVFLLANLLGLMLLAGCSSQQPLPPVTDKSSRAENSSGYVFTRRSEYSGDVLSVQEQLLKQYSEWQGVPYRLGGTSKSGIDCSAFVQASFSSQFATSLPRTTLQQAEVGARIDRSQLRPGDLVFFKTGKYSRHVGIYIGNESFLHSGETLGVSITPLSNPYWRKRFWQARRPVLKQ